MGYLFIGEHDAPLFIITIHTSFLCMFQNRRPDVGRWTDHERTKKLRVYHAKESAGESDNDRCMCGVVKIGATTSSTPSSCSLRQYPSQSSSQP
jgi:hypothetical protein